MNSNMIFNVIFYWIPVIVCLSVFTARTKKEIYRDFRQREKYSITNGYTPKVTVSTILGRIFISVCPILNLLIAIVDIPGDFLFPWIEKILTRPIVKPKKR